jgi:hypothetical protein
MGQILIPSLETLNAKTRQDIQYNGLGNKYFSIFFYTFAHPPRDVATV